MKRFLLSLLALVISVSAYGAVYNYGKATPSVSLLGDPGGTHKYTFSSDTAVTLQAAYEAGGGTWIVGGRPPSGVLITVETNGIRFTLGNSTPSVDNVGHVLDSGTSIRLFNTGMIESMKACNKSAGSNGVMQITTEY
jgi:hypothetical protein